MIDVCLDYRGAIKAIHASEVMHGARTHDSTHIEEMMVPISKGPKMLALDTASGTTTILERWGKDSTIGDVATPGDLLHRYSAV
jgi:hypothetical protein